MSDADLRAEVAWKRQLGDTALPFGPFGAPRSAAEHAQFHAGIEFIEPAWERDVMILLARGWKLREVAVLADRDEMEVERAVKRVCRTLATWERNACKWSTRYVAQEPQALYPDSDTLPSRGSFNKTPAL
jgi:hypothetical protein